MSRRGGVVEAISTGLYLGYIGVMPGTVASFVTCILVYWSSISQGILVGLAGSVFCGGVYVVRQFLKTDQSDDPSCVVIDEIAGMMVALVGVPPSWILYGAAFFIFRLYDIFKLFPVGFVEARVGGALGVMLDDIVAACCVRLIFLVAGGW